MNKRELTKGNTYQYALHIEACKITIICGIIIALFFAGMIIIVNHSNKNLKAEYEAQLKAETNSLIENISIAGVATDSVVLNIDGNEHIYNYSFMPENTSEDFGRTKTYEFYQQITSATAPQTKLNRVSDAYTDNQGYRKILDYYLVAMGSYYGTIGDVFEVELDTGRIILVIKGDTKADKDTDATHRYQASDLSVLEFICDRDTFKGNPTTRFKGGITNIKLVGHYDF